MSQTSETMRCVEVVEVVTEYLERSLDPAERERVDAHLAGCAGCEAYLAQMRQTVSALRRIGGEESAPRDLDALLEAFRRKSPS